METDKKQLKASQDRLKVLAENIRILNIRLKIVDRIKSKKFVQQLVNNGDEETLKIIEKYSKYERSKV